MSLTFQLKRRSLGHLELRNSATMTTVERKLGAGGKLKVTFPNEFAARAPLFPLFFTILCVPPSDLSVSSVLLGLGSLPNQR